MLQSIWMPRLTRKKKEQVNTILNQLLVLNLEEFYLWYCHSWPWPTAGDTSIFHSFFLSLFWEIGTVQVCCFPPVVVVYLLTMSSTFCLLLYPVWSGTGRGEGILWRAVDKQAASKTKWTGWWKDQTGGQGREISRRTVAGAGQRLRANGQAITHHGWR